MPQSHKPVTPIAQKSQALSKVLQKLQGEVKIVQTALNAPASENIDVYAKADEHLLFGGHLKST
jgi:hypothetical protein